MMLLFPGCFFNSDGGGFQIQPHNVNWFLSLPTKTHIQKMKIEVCVFSMIQPELTLIHQLKAAWLTSYRLH